MNEVEQEHNRKHNEDTNGKGILGGLIIGTAAGFFFTIYPITVGVLVGVSVFGLLIWKRKG